MFYAESDIKNIINCPQCQNRYVEPKLIVPCLKTLCKRCIEELSDEKWLECPFCKITHLIPEGGFQSNPTIEMFLRLQPKEVHRNGKLINELTEKLKDFTSLYEDFSLKASGVESSLNQHCDLIKIQIDLISEQKIQQINEIREKHLKSVDEYRGSCLANISLNKSKINEEVRRLHEYIDKLKGFIGAAIIDDQEAKLKIHEIDSKREELELSIENIKFLQFNGNELSYKANETDTTQTFLGELIYTKLLGKFAHFFQIILKILLFSINYLNFRDNF